MVHNRALKEVEQIVKLPTAMSALENIQETMVSKWEDTLFLLGQSTSMQAPALWKIRGITTLPRASNARLTTLPMLRTTATVQVCNLNLAKVYTVIPVKMEVRTTQLLV
jgi:hypothetical protein